jgi:anaerobic magnesium-protoporphyrin IX monomethyl ester cyclase
MRARKTIHHDTYKKPPPQLKVLLIAMPDKASCFDRLLDIPNLGLCSIAGNIEDLTTDIRILDLSIHRRNIAKIVERELSLVDPDIVGLSSMSFQYDSAKRIARLCKNWKDEILVALGGYHPTLMYREIGDSPDRLLFDFLIRGEGELVFHELLRTLPTSSRSFESIKGLSYRSGYVYQHNPPAPLADLEHLRLPARGYRVSGSFRFMGKRYDCVETSRGCLQSCGFCSIQQMYGTAFRAYPVDRVVADLLSLKAAGVQGAFIVDDNITTDVGRLKTLCRAIIAAGVNDLDYIVQASVSGAALDPELAPLMKKAGFQLVFLGIESGNVKSLRAMGKAGVPRRASLAVSLMQEAGIMVIGGLIVGNPDDTAADVRATFRYAFDLGLDHAIVQCLTPYPGTRLRERLLREGMVTNVDDYSRYNGFIANVRTRHMGPEQIARAVWSSGIRLYFHPIYLISSRMWKAYKHVWFGLLTKSLGLVATGFRNNLYQSRHRF